jgi:hypothetical protein
MYLETYSISDYRLELQGSQTANSYLGFYVTLVHFYVRALI